MCEPDGLNTALGPIKFDHVPTVKEKTVRH
jgi:hypothetical protein